MVVSLEFIREAVLRRHKADPIRNNKFNCQCPAHDGTDKNAGFFVLADGSIGFKCFSHQCDRDDARQALGLDWSDFDQKYTRDESYTPPTTPRDDDIDWLVIQFARSDRQSRKPVSEKDKRREFQAFKNLRAKGLKLSEGTPVADEIQYEAYLRGMK